MKNASPASMTGIFIALFIQIFSFMGLMTLTCPLFGESLAGDQAHFICQASYYTYQSCIKEGTSGVWTASGERYDENGFTCASREFKYGTILRVKCNGREVLVKVNDFGPAKRLHKIGRRIDLSKGAFQALEKNLKVGVITVEVEVVSGGLRKVVK